MKLEILCATMHQKNFDKINEMNIKTNVLFANQADTFSYEEKLFDGKKARMVTTSTRGVGINRNLALKFADGDILMLADDDMLYEDDMEEKILEAYEKLPQADVIIFGTKYAKGGQVYATRRLVTQKLPFHKSMKFGTYAISVRKSMIQKYNINFNELFGGGCIYSHGEDSDFIMQCLKKKLKMYTYDYIIGTTNKDASSWFNGYNEKYFYDTGAMARNSFGWLAYPYMLYILSKRWDTKLTSCEKWKYMRTGYKNFPRLISYNECYLGKC